MADQRWQESPDGTRLGIQSSGQPIDWDREDLENERIENGECPNGHGPMEQDAPRDWRCVACGFVYSQRVIDGRAW